MEIFEVEKGFVFAVNCFMVHCFPANTFTFELLYHSIG